jgi:hypothetical protein
VTITKQTLPDTQPGSFAFSATEASGTTVTPASFNLSDNGTQTVQVPFSSTGGGRTLTITEAQLSGWDATTSIICTTPTGASASSYVTVNNTTRTITASLTTTNFGALCTVTNTRIPTVRLTKTTLGGASGPFTFTSSNLVSNHAAIATVTAGTAVASSSGAVSVSTVGTNVTITEVMSVPYFLSAVNCTDANSSRTGNTGAFGSFSGSTVTIAAARILPGADITCALTNTKYEPALTIDKTANNSGPVSVGTVITYTYIITNTGNAFIDNVTVTDVHNGYGAVPVPGSEVLVTDALPTGNSTDGGANAVWDHLSPGDTIRFTANYTVVQSDIDYRQ